MEPKPDTSSNQMIVSAFKQSSSKGKIKTEINQYIRHCQEKIIALLLEKQNDPQLKNTQYRSIINSTLLRLKKRLEAEQHERCLEV
jgi:hypothetical protein